MSERQSKKRRLAEQGICVMDDRLFRKIEAKAIREFEAQAANEEMMKKRRDIMRKAPKQK